MEKSGLSLTNGINIEIFSTAEQALQKTEEEFDLIFENAKDAVFWADADTGLITKCNKAAENLLEKDRLDIIGYSHLFLHPTKKREYYSKMFNNHIQYEDVSNVEAEIMTSSCKIVPVQITAITRTVFGKKIIQGIFRDISREIVKEREIKLLNRRLKHLELKDPHTKIYNHSFFEGIVESEFKKAKESSLPLSLIMIDIDYFKSINEVYGHSFGDAVLQQFAKKLRKMARLHDYVIRFGGEEFVIVLPNMDRAGTMKIADKVLSLIKVYQFGDMNAKVRLKLSIAIASYPEDTVSSHLDFIKILDDVLCKAKECGGDRILCLKDISKPYIHKVSNDSNDIQYLKEQLDKITREANQSLVESIFALVKTIELKDHYTGDHVEKTVYYATELSMALGLDAPEVVLIEQAAMLHDLGKIGISESILLKKGKLTEEEFEEIKKHPEIGVAIIRPVRFFHDLIPLILYHHERWDGLGYPVGLKGKEIPIGARVIAVADVYQALISDRPYRPAYSQDESKKIIKEGSGRQFDPKVVEAFLTIV